MSENKEIRTVRDVIKVDDELLENITVLIDEQASESLLIILTDLHPADIAEIINYLKVDDASFVFNLLDTETAGEVLIEIDENLREKILKKIDTEKITDIIDELESDDATDIVSDLPESVAEQVLDNINVEDSEDVKELLKYPEDTAGGIMNSDYVFVHTTATVEEAIAEVRKNAEEFEHIYHIYITEVDEELVGTVQLKSLLINPLNIQISSIMDDDLIYVNANADQEEVANLMEKYDLVSIGVVDDNKKLLGRITIDDVVDVIHEEAAEDMQKLAGLSEEEEISDSAFRISRIRMPWLLVSLVGELLSAAVLSSFQASIEKVIVAASFIPIVMALGGSSGTQAAIVMVRGLSSGSLWINKSLKKLSKEFLVSLLNGLGLAIVLMLATHFIFKEEFMFSMVLSISLFIIIIFATMLGAFVPILMKKFGADPAIATGPFVTTMNDIFGLLIYLSLITTFIVP
ncbi:MAG: magnesium transporter [Bacteroidetes bacterium]|nr:magnesium transporter [Bacteroidota bacterium]MBU1678279.1 magnesium transporter [Bacteroidota bacterium]MBU2507653.1 magnesium transporter [Bacteroidota bacterium]